MDLETARLDESIWAKSPTGDDPDGQRLTSHTLDVIKSIVALRKRTIDLGLLIGDDRFWSRLLLAATLHDLGKCCPGFQAVVHGHARRFGLRHEVFSVAMVRWIVPDVTDRARIGAAILTHHKEWNRAFGECCGGPTPGTKKELGSNWLSIAQRLLTELIWPAVELTAGPFPKNWSEGARRPWPEGEAWTSIEDTATECREYVDSLGAADTSFMEGRFLRGALMIADHSASAAQDLSYLGLSDLNAAMSQSSFPPANSWYYHQRAASEVVGHGLLVAPTGSGKTEAALLWYQNQRRHSSYEANLFYSLPFQASMNAMKTRLDRTFGANRELVALHHSRSLQALYAQALDKGYAEADAQRIAKNARSLARLHALPIRVMSPYPWLGAAFGLRGQEAIWTDAAGSCFVLDEIHAYDAGRLGRILALCRHLAKDHGAKFFFMSATFPRRLSSLLAEQFQGMQIVEAEDSLRESFRRHEVHLVDEELVSESSIERIVQFVKSGGSPLIVATTVERAKQVYRKLKERLTLPVELLHSRFNGQDRSRKEQRLAEARGVDQAAREAVVLVATQVVEVSLNVDFDALFSDPAPLEALFQRFGRVNRQAGANKRGLRPVFVSRVIPNGSPVYDARLVRFAIDELEHWNGTGLDELALQGMIDRIYDSEMGTEWETTLRTAMTRFESEVLSNCLPFVGTSDHLRQMFKDMFDGYEVLPRALQKEYEYLLKQEPARASALTIPVSGRQLRSMRDGAEWKDNVAIVDRFYSPDSGLEIRKLGEGDGL